MSKKRQKEIVSCPAETDGTDPNIFANGKSNNSKFKFNCQRVPNINQPTQIDRQNSSSALLINQDELTFFCKNLIEYIKHSLKIDTYDFENYLNYNKIYNLDIKYLLSDQFLTYLLDLSHIKHLSSNQALGESRNRAKARRCIEVIVFALIRSRDYNELKLNLIEHTGLQEGQVRNNIKNFIPLLSSINPNFNAINWLPESTTIPITYNDILNLIAPYGHKINTSEKEFYERVKKDRTPPSKTYFELICHDCNNSFLTSWMNIKACNDDTNKCPYCAGNFPITFKDILDLAKLRGWTVLSSEEEFNERRLIDKSNPSKTKFIIQCENGYIFPYIYNYLKMHSDCQYCVGNAPISYNDLKQIIEERNGKIITTQEEFELAKQTYKTTPCETKVKIICSNNHLFNSTWGQIGYNNNWCPYCSSGRSENIIRWYLNKIFNYINSLFSQTSSIFFSKCNLKDLNIVENFTSYTGRLQYDGYSQINWYSGFNLRIPRNSFKNNRTYKKVYYSKNFKSFKDFVDIFYRDFQDFLLYNDIILISLPFGEIELKKEKYNIRLLDFSLFLPSYEASNLNVLKLAYEFNGYQHFLYPNIYHDILSKFLSQIINDLYKKKLSFENNIIPLIFPYYINPKMNDSKKIQDYLIKKLEALTSIDFNNYKIPQFNHLTREAFKDILSYTT